MHILDAAERSSGVTIAREESEEWRDIAGYEGFYQVSDLGRVRSLDRIIERRTGPCKQSGRILKPGTKGQEKYLAVNLCQYGEMKFWCVHILVLEAFVGPRPEGMQCCHGPAGSSINCVSNLSWGTRSKNQGEDKRRDGTSNTGTRKPRPVCRSDGRKFKSIAAAARENNCSSSAIGYACRGKQKRAAGYGWEYVA